MLFFSSLLLALCSAMAPYDRDVFYLVSFHLLEKGVIPTCVSVKSSRGGIIFIPFSFLRTYKQFRALLPNYP